MPLATAANQALSSAASSADAATVLQNMTLAISALITAIGGIIGLATKFYTDSIKHGKVDDREAKVIEILNDISRSLEETDRGAKGQCTANITFGKNCYICSSIKIIY